MTRRGFPHSEIHGSKLVCSSPWLIAACHVLHRLLVPRHPPNALSSLTTNRFLCERHPKMTIHESRVGAIGLLKRRLNDIAASHHALGRVMQHFAVDTCYYVLLFGFQRAHRTGAAPISSRVGQERVELSTSRLSGVRSNQLSYWPGGSIPQDQIAKKRFERD